jgi:hypothetical protein
MQNATNGFPQNGDASQEGIDAKGADAGGGVGGGLAAAIAATAAMLRLAEGMVVAGRPVDLAGLEDRIGLVCAQALDLPAEDGARARVALVALLCDLDALSVALRRA